MEKLSTSPVTERLLQIASVFDLGFIGKMVGVLRGHIGAKSDERLRFLVETIANEVKAHVKLLDEQQRRTSDIAMAELFEDAARKAHNTRSKTRIKRIALILFNALVEPKAADEDEVEEMMRVAMELGDRDIYYLRELVRLEGHMLKSDLNHIPRHTAHVKWIEGPWGERVDPELDSVFNKLESYGLVSKIAPPNNFNIMADYQNRFVLLPKGLRFVELIKNRATELGNG